MNPGSTLDGDAGVRDDHRVTTTRISAPRRRQLAAIVALAHDHGIDAAAFGDVVTIWVDDVEREVRTLAEAVAVLP